MYMNINQTGLIMPRNPHQMPEIEKGHTITPTRAMKERGEAMASSFEHYCRERWQFARNYANKLIASSQVIENLNKGTIVPKTESQARPLTKLEPGDKRNAILIALHEFPEKSQQEIAEQVGCAQSYVNRIKTEANITSDNCPSTRIDSAGRIMPTSYAKPEPGQ